MLRWTKTAGARSHEALEAANGTVLGDIRQPKDGRWTSLCLLPGEGGTTHPDAESARAHLERQVRDWFVRVGHPLPSTEEN